MSLEAAIQENTATMRELINKLGTGPALPGVDKPAAAPAPARPAATKPPQAPKGAAPAASVAASAPAATYRDAERAVLDLAKVKQREAAVKLLATFKGADGKPATNLKQVLEKDWGALIAAAKTAQAAQ